MGPVLDKGQSSKDNPKVFEGLMPPPGLKETQAGIGIFEATESFGEGRPLRLSALQMRLGPNEVLNIHLRA